MDNFRKVCLQFKERLGRRLNDEEVDFLRWIHEQHMTELQLTKWERDSEKIK